MTSSQNHKPPALKKVLTGIVGLDDITAGGLPAGRPTIVCGGPGCGKSMFGVEFLVHGSANYGEPGVLVSFEETEEELQQNASSLGFDLAALVKKKQLSIDHIRVERSDLIEAGSFDLEGLFLRVQHAVDSIKAKRVVFDSLEALFSGFSNQGLLRAEIRRLFRWLKDRHLTTIITAERGQRSLTRSGLEEYVSDCVILLDHRVEEQVSTRRLRIVKYRGSLHGTNEYPFLIDQGGISVLPITSLALDHAASHERISTGITDLDEMFEGKGYYRGSTTLISGSAGSGKTSIASQFVDATCRRGERCLFVALEESMAQVARNMRSIGIDLDQWVKKGLLEFYATRATQFGLEMHLARFNQLVDRFHPSVVVIDPVTNLLLGGSRIETRAMLVRLIDFLKQRIITAVFTSLTPGGSSLEQSEVDVSSFIDSWLVLRELESDGERNRGLYVVKARGMAHSNQIREFLLTREGIKLVPAYLGMGKVLTGSARLAQQAREQEEALQRQLEVERREHELKRKREALEAQITAMRAQFEAEAKDIEYSIQQSRRRDERRTKERDAMAVSRKVNPRSAEQVAIPGNGGWQ